MVKRILKETVLYGTLTFFNMFLNIVENHYALNVNENTLRGKQAKENLTINNINIIAIHCIYKYNYYTLYIYMIVYIVRVIWKERIQCNVLISMSPSI